MDCVEFYQKVDKHKKLTWLGCAFSKSGELEVFTDGGRIGTRLAIPVREIKRLAWEELESVLTGERLPRVLSHMTRIVGYYSMVRNWNGSKHAELRDRHKTNKLYKLPECGEPTLEDDPQVPEELAECLASVVQERMVCQVFSDGRKKT